MTYPAANEASHLRNAWTAVGPLEPHFRGQEPKMSNRLLKSRPDHDPKFTRLYDLLPTGSSLFMMSFPVGM